MVFLGSATDLPPVDGVGHLFAKVRYRRYLDILYQVDVT